MTYSADNFGKPVPAGTTSKFPINNSGGTITKLTPVRASGNNIDVVDVSVEAQATAVIGVLAADVVNGGISEVVGNGTITNITTSAAVGDVMWIAKDGSLTNTKPDIGIIGFVAGDWVVKMGVVAKNVSNPSQKDFVVNFHVVGEL